MKGLSFSEAMVKAWLAGRKDVTRRLMNPQPIFISSGECGYPYPVGRPNDKRWRHFASEKHFRKGVAQDFARYLLGETVYIKELRPIAFGDGKYAVGNDGNVYDVSKTLPKKRQAYLNHNGYEQINLRYKGESHPFRMNRLVCEAFYGPPLPHETECRHMDGDRRNNWPENLDWGTRQQNALDASADGALNGDRKAQSKLSADDINAIRGSNEKQDVLAKRYGVGQPAISKVQSHKRHTPLPTQPPRNHPAWASRSHARIVSVRPEKVQEITEKEAVREGVMARIAGEGEKGPIKTYRTGFVYVWESLHPGSWEKNDWIWRIELEKLEADHA